MFCLVPIIGSAPKLDGVHYFPLWQEQEQYLTSFVNHPRNFPGHTLLVTVDFRPSCQFVMQNTDLANDLCFLLSTLHERIQVSLNRL